MVSLRRRKLLGLCSGKSSFLAPFPRNFGNGTALENLTHNARTVSVHPMPSADSSQPQGKVAVKVGPGSSNVSAATSAEEQTSQPNQQGTEEQKVFQSFSGLPIKRRKRHRRKQVQNQEPCLMRGVYFKNMKWQAAIKVDKKQIHLGTVGSQEEAARLYDRAAFMCGREPNFELLEEEKRELANSSGMNSWHTLCSITNKKYRRRIGSSSEKKSESPLESSDWDSKQGANNGLSASEEAGQDSSAS